MTALFVTLIIVGIVLLAIGLFVEVAKWLIWLGIIIAVIAVIAWLLRYIMGRRSV